MSLDLVVPINLVSRHDFQWDFQIQITFYFRRKSLRMVCFIDQRCTDNDYSLKQIISIIFLMIFVQITTLVNAFYFVLMYSLSNGWWQLIII